MAKDLAKLVVRLEANSERLVKEVEESRKALKRLERDAHMVASAVKGAMVGVAGAMAGIAFAAAKKQMEDYVKTADRVGKVAEIMGVQTEEYSKLEYAAKMSNVSTEQLESSMKKLNATTVAAIGGNREAMKSFEAIGISLDDIRNKSPDETLKLIADRFARAEDGAAKTAIAMRLFGESGARMIPMLNQGTTGIESMGKEAERLGIVIDEKAKEAAAQFNDNMTRLTEGMKGAAYEIASSMLPELNRLTQALLDARDAGTGVTGAFKQMFGVPQLEVLRGQMDELLKRRSQLQKAMESPGRMGFMEGGGPLGFSPRSKDRLLDDLREVEAQINAINDKMLELQRRLEPPALPKKNLVINIDTGAANLAAKENDFFSKRSSDFARQTIAEDMARIQAIQDSARAAMDRLNEEMASDAVRMEMAYANRVRVVQEAANAEIISEQKKADLLLKLEDDLNRDRMALQRAYQHQMLGSYADIFGSLSEIVGSGSKKAFELSKNLARAQTIVSTYSAAQKAFESQIIAGDPTSLPRAYAAAAAAVLAGMARMTAINRTSFSGGGGGASGGAAPVYLADSQTNLPIQTRRDSDVSAPNVNITIQAVDTEGAVDLLQKNRAVIANIVQSEYDRRGAVGGPIR